MNFIVFINELISLMNRKKDTNLRNRNYTSVQKNPTHPKMNRKYLY